MRFPSSYWLGRVMSRKSLASSLTSKVTLQRDNLHRLYGYFVLIFLMDNSCILHKFMSRIYDENYYPCKAVNKMY